jgi:PhnB protein
MLRLTPFLLFDGNCAEAMEFYSTCFNGELTLTRLADTPMKAQHPVENHGKIVYAYLKSDAIEFSATDWLHQKHVRQLGNTTAMYVNGTDGIDIDRLRTVFDKLSAGAEQQFFVKLMDMPFGVYGRFADRYGVEWYFRGETGAQA